MSQQQRIREPPRPTAIRRSGCPMRAGGLSMIVVRPDEVDGLDAVIKSLDGGKLDALVARARPRRRRRWSRSRCRASRPNSGPS